MVIKLFNKKSITILLIIIIIFTLLISVSSIIPASASKQNGKNVPIIMYHHFSKDTSKLNKYVTSPKQFEEDLKYIKDKGYTTITMTQLINYVKNDAKLPKKPIIITIDDGFESVYSYVYPILKKQKMCAVVGVVGSFSDFSTEHQEHNVDYSYLDWKEVSKLSKSKNFEIQNHSYNMHTNTGDRIGTNRKYNETEDHYRKALKDDICKNQEMIFSVTGKMPNTFVYPFGNCSELSNKILKEIGFSAALTCEEKVNIINQDTDLMRLKRFNRPNGTSTEEFFEDILE